MVLIAVNNFQDNSLGAYELPEGSVIIDLKAEIEATEGIPIGHQRLLRKVNDGQDLKDNGDLNSLISDGSLNAIVYLVQAQLFYHLRQDETNNFESEMSIPVNLDEPVRACLLWKTLDEHYKIDPSTANISVLGYGGRPTFNISDLDKSFSYYGVYNGDTVHITYVPPTREGQPVLRLQVNKSYGMHMPPPNGDSTSSIVWTSPPPDYESTGHMVCISPPPGRRLEELYSMYSSFLRRLQVDESYGIHESPPNDDSMSSIVWTSPPPDYGSMGRMVCISPPPPDYESMGHMVCISPPPKRRFDKPYSMDDKPYGMCESPPPLYSRFAPRLPANELHSMDHLAFRSHVNVFYSMHRFVPRSLVDELHSMNWLASQSRADKPASSKVVPGGKSKIVCAKYDWNGEIMHPNLKGLSLKQTALITVELGAPSSKRHCSPGWLYGSSISLSGVRLFGLLTRTVEGYFPENFVSSGHRGLTIERPEITGTEILDVPSLPPFHFPPAYRMSFRMPVGDNGHSFLKFTVNYECVSSPIDPTHVTISLLCTTHDIRRISAVSVFITIPESAPQDVQVCENEAHQKEIHTDKEVTETQSKGKHFDGINIGTPGTTVGLQGGISRNHLLGGTEKGQKVSRRKVTAAIDNEDTICWNLKAPTSKLDEDGLDGEESITFVLRKKPVEFKYKCRVTHARDGVEKTTQRITNNKPWEFFLSR